MNTVPDGAKPICTNCGFGAPPGTMPAAQPMAAPGFAGPPQGMPPQGMPPQGYMMPNFKRPGQVTAVAVLGFIAAGILLLAGLLFLTLGGIGGAVANEAGAEGVGAIIAAFAMIFAVVFLGMGALQLVVSIGILKGKGWARITQVVLSGIGILLNLATLVTGDMSQLVGLAVNVMIIVFLFMGTSTTWFRTMAHMRPMGA